MIRQAINCDMCGTEKQAVTSHWFVAYEQGGELKLRGWESPRQSRKDVKHLCGQKCVQRLTANFTAAVMATGNGEIVKDTTPEALEKARPELQDQDDLPILVRMGYDAGTAKSIEEESWAGPAKPRETTWGSPRNPESSIPRTVPDPLLHAARVKTYVSARLSHSA